MQFLYGLTFMTTNVNFLFIGSESFLKNILFTFALCLQQIFFADVENL